MTQLRNLIFAAALTAAWLDAQPLGAIPMPDAHGMNMLDGQAGPVYGKPFSATEVRRTSQVLADGTHVDRTDTSTFVRDDRGRMRTANDRSILIFDPVAGYNYDVNVGTKTYRRGKVPDRLNTVSIAVAGGRSSTSTSSGDGQVVSRTLPKGAVREELAEQMMGGVRAKGERITMTIPAGAFGNDRDIKVVNERWYSDDLQILLKSTNSDPRFGVTTYELANIVRGQPDPAVFMPPADYREKE
jgi:hypothetical protein